MNYFFVFASFLFFSITSNFFVSATSSPPQKCVEAMSYNYFKIPDYASPFTASSKFSIDPDQPQNVIVSNIAIDFNESGPFDSQMICVKDENLNPFCSSDFSTSFSVPSENSTFKLQAFLNSTIQGTYYEFEFGYGVYDEGSFSFPTGEMFNTDVRSCITFFQNDTHYNSITNITQCCTAFKPINETSQIYAPVCKKLKSRTTIYNVDDNFSIFATAKVDYINAGGTLFAHTELAGPQGWFVIFWINNYDECEVFESNNVTCPFYIPYGDSKLLLQMEPIQTSVEEAPMLLVGRLIIRNNQTLMEEGKPFTKKNDCQYFSQQYTDNQVATTSFCCTDFVDD